ncbi:MAG: RDD family protein [Pseudomonadales bacterium]|nr:RDD family protein [Pseudomonadales bacterium]
MANPKPPTDPTISYVDFPAAGLPRRLASMVYDGLIVLALWFLIAVLYLAAAGVDTERSSLDLQLTLLPLLLLGTFLFYYWFWTHGGQTLGMRAWRIQVVDARLDGRPLTLGQCLSRYLISLLSLGCFGLGYLWVVISASGDSWHDSLSNTRTLVLPKAVNRNLTPNRAKPVSTDKRR